MRCSFIIPEVMSVCKKFELPCIKFDDMFLKVRCLKRGLLNSTVEAFRNGNFQIGDFT